MSQTVTTTTSPSPKYPVIVLGDGPVPSPGMIVGEAPGREEIKAGIPFVGSSGKLLRETLSEFSPTTEWYITNIFKGDVGEGNRNPTTEEIEAHWPLLVEEYHSVRPSGILLLGAVAVRQFLGSSTRMADVVGKRIRGMEEFVDTQLYPCWHPAFIRRQPSRLEDFRYAVARFALTTEVLYRYERKEGTGQTQG